MKKEGKTKLYKIFSPRNLLIGFVGVIVLLGVFNYFNSYKDLIYDNDNYYGKLASRPIFPPNSGICKNFPKTSDDFHITYTCSGYSDGTIICNVVPCGWWDFGDPQCEREDICIDEEPNECPECGDCGTCGLVKKSDDYVAGCVPNSNVNGNTCGGFLGIGSGTCEDGKCV